MKKQLTLVVLMLSSVFGLGQIKSGFHADQDSLAEQEIKNLEYFLASLIEKGDADTYGGYLADDYVRIGANGVISTKDQIIEGMRKGKAQVIMRPRDLHVRVYGNTAILRGILDLETKSGDQVTKRSSVITKVFIKRNNKWFMASLQGTPLP